MSDFDLDEMRYDLRHHRAQQLAAFVMNIVSPYLDGENRSHKNAYNAIVKAFYDAGYETLTDDVRREAGLPARDEKGWTKYELLALEQKRIEALMKPISIQIPSGE